MSSHTPLLTYCSNIHAGESWEDHFQALVSNFPLIKQSFSPGQPLGLGLRLSNAASLSLEEPAKLEIFKEWLHSQKAFVFTMNGFPYGEFHQTRVKDQVHFPDWATAERLDYTLRLFTILADLLPPGMDGGVSTSPLSYKFWYQPGQEYQEARAKATLHILLVAERLFQIYAGTGKLLHLDIEPEPDGMLETGIEFTDWYEKELLPAGLDFLGLRLGLLPAETDALIRRHICLCYDICHFAIGFEDHTEMITLLAEKNIRIGKLQISAALKTPIPESLADRAIIALEMAKYNEPVYLHQVVSRSKTGELQRYRDLPAALSDLPLTEAAEWRVHFHIPVFLETLTRLQSTQADIREVLAIQKRHPFTSHLEIETYTWEVLPESLKLPMDQSIARELEWVRAELNSKP